MGKPGGEEGNLVEPGGGKGGWPMRPCHTAGGARPGLTVQGRINVTAERASRRTANGHGKRQTSLPSPCILE